MRQPEFLYFDLGRVLVDFSVERMLRQMGEVAGLDPARVEQAVFQDGLQQRYELGQISTRQFYHIFCERTSTRPDYETLRRAGSDIFEVIPDMLPVVAQLGQAGYRMGILSNTCESHWEHCLRRFRLVAETFQVHALSYRIGAAKPEAAIFLAAAEMAGCRPQEVFYVDDMAEHVAGAKAVGFDAVQYTSTPALVGELRARGLRFSY